MAEEKNIVWSDKIENTIATIKQNCSVYKWMNMFTANRLSLRYNILMYSLVALGPLTGVLSTLQINQDNDNRTRLEVVVAILSFTSGLLSGLIKYSKLEQRINKHKEICSKYASLENNINRQLSLNFTERISAGEYLQWVSSSYDELFNASPMISEDLYNQWIKETKPETKPDITPKNNNIEIQIDKFADGKMLYEINRLKNHN